jgi:choline-glycine betaine transporter
MKNNRISSIFKYASVGLTILTNEGLLGMIGLSNTGNTMLIIVLIATVASIVSSVYSEKEKIQKNSETTLNYLQTVKSLIRLYDILFDEMKSKINDISNLTKIIYAFAHKSESILMQENVKWSEIQHTKGD